MVTCSVSECDVTQRYNPNKCTFHRFPTNPLIQRKWLRFIKRGRWTPNKNSCICSKHFESKCFIQRKRRRILMKDSIPTLFVPGNPGASTSSKKTHKGRPQIRTTVRPPVAESSSVDDIGDGENESMYEKAAPSTATKEPKRLVGSGLERTHEGFKCNLCNENITGFRYTCVQCADFDICMACETRGAHDQHYVLRIPGRRPYLEICTVLERIRQELLGHAPAGDDAHAEDADADSVKVEVKEEADPGPDPLGSASLMDFPLSADQPSDAVKPWSISDVAVEQIKTEVDTVNSDTEIESQPTYETLTIAQTPRKHSTIKTYGENIKTVQEKQTELGRYVQYTSVQQKRKIETVDTRKLHIEIDTGTIVIPQMAGAKEDKTTEQVLDKTICEVFTHRTAGDPGSGKSVSKIAKTGDGQTKATVSPAVKTKKCAVRKKM